MYKHLELRGLSYSYAAFELRPTSIEFDRESVVGLVGPNGAGKTTLMSCAAGLLPSSLGEVRLDGRSLDQVMRRRMIAYCSSRDIFYRELSFKENARFVRKFHPDWSTAFEEDLVRRFRLNYDKRPSAASAGMLAKFAIVIALARGAKAILLDEPWNALDPESRAELDELIRTIPREFGVPLLISSHELLNVQETCSSFLFLKCGTVVAAGSLEDLRKTAELPESSDLNSVYLELARS